MTTMIAEAFMLGTARPEWQAEALCNTGDALLVDTMLPAISPRSDRPASKHPKLEAAKRICARCPVAVACLDYALSLFPDPDGVWGGTDERERMAIRRERALPIHGAPRPINHGTDGGYMAHLRAGTPPCPECREAHRLREQHTRPSRAGVRR